MATIKQLYAGFVQDRYIDEGSIQKASDDEKIDFVANFVEWALVDMKQSDLGQRTEAEWRQLAHALHADEILADLLDVVQGATGATASHR